MKKINLNNFYFKLFFVVFFSVIFSGFLEIPSARAGASSIVYFSPASKEIQSGQDLEIEARINPASNEISAVEIHLQFDPSKLHLKQMSHFAEAWNVIAGKTINNENGTANIILGVPIADPPTGVKNDAQMLHLVFETVGNSGESIISFSEGTEAAAFGETTNVISEKQSARINIASGAELCTDLTPFGQCSGERPKFCDNGSLVDKCDQCGCSSDKVCGSSQKCENPVRRYTAIDFVRLVSDWLKTGIISLGDVNGDQKVNSRDLGIMMSSWQK